MMFGISAQCHCYFFLNFSFLDTSISLSFITYSSYPLVFFFVNKKMELIDLETYS
ncbi:hypothetical protein Sjap_017420 [Stephania japonica]|uniref:Uncharacterized protein n=1 Tax=Stephania japonica TaxID=461633 RepID=A0AAP0NKC4_9MAGN